jgi:hypothetical protein
MKRRRFLQSLALIPTALLPWSFVPALTACSGNSDDTASPAKGLTLNEALANRVDVSNMDVSELDLVNTEFNAVFIEDKKADISFTDAIIQASAGI